VVELCKGPGRNRHFMSMPSASIRQGFPLAIIGLVYAGAEAEFGNIYCRAEPDFASYCIDVCFAIYSRASTSVDSHGPLISLPGLTLTA
jgi:hypothetical protein